MASMYRVTDWLLTHSHVNSASARFRYAKPSVALRRKAGSPTARIQEHRLPLLMFINTRPSYLRSLFWKATPRPLPHHNSVAKISLMHEQSTHACSKPSVPPIFL